MRGEGVALYTLATFQAEFVRGEGSHNVSPPHVASQIREQGAGACQVTAAVMPEAAATSATRVHADELKPPPGAPTSSAVTVVVPKESRWQKQWAHWQDKVLPCPSLPSSSHALSDPLHSKILAFNDSYF